MESTLSDDHLNQTFQQAELQKNDIVNILNFIKTFLEYCTRIVGH